MSQQLDIGRSFLFEDNVLIKMFSLRKERICEFLDSNSQIAPRFTLLGS